MVPDPVMQELYATKEMLAARHNYDLDALVAAIARGPSWAPVKKHVRTIRTAQARFERLVDDPIIRELREVREQIMRENDNDLRKHAEKLRTQDTDRQQEFRALAGKFNELESP